MINELRIEKECGKMKFAYNANMWIYMKHSLQLENLQLALAGVA